MKYKAIIIGIAVLIALVGVNGIAAQQANEYRAYVASPFIDEDVLTEGTNATMVMKVTFVPIYPSATYTLVAAPVSAVVDMSQPTKINDQIAAAVKQKPLRAELIEMNDQLDTLYDKMFNDNADLKAKFDKNDELRRHLNPEQVASKLK